MNISKLSHKYIGFIYRLLALPLVLEIPRKYPNFQNLLLNFNRKLGIFATLMTTVHVSLVIITSQFFL